MIIENLIELKIFISGFYSHFFKLNNFFIGQKLRLRKNVQWKYTLNNKL